VRRSSGLATTVDASSGRYIVGGKLSADLELVQSHGTVNDRFGVQVTRSPFATFGGVVGVVLLLIVAAYAESMLRSLRRGRRRDNRSNVAGLAIDGVLGGLTAALWGWMFGIASPSLISFAIPAIIGASAGLLAGFAALQVGKRERARRQSNRLVLVARRQVMPSTSEPARAKAQG